MVNINVFIVGIRENKVISTNSFVVDAMLPTMVKHVDIWTLELVTIQAFHLWQEKSRKLKQLLLLKIIYYFAIT